MEESKDIRCDCGQLIARTRNGHVFVWCKKCKREHEISLESLLTKITEEMRTEHDCRSCVDRIGKYCPYESCKY